MKLKRRLYTIIAPGKADMDCYLRPKHKCLPI